MEYEAKRIFREGEARGRAEGEACGRAEGEAIGRLNISKKMSEKLYAEGRDVKSIAEFVEVSESVVEEWLGLVTT